VTKKKDYVMRHYSRLLGERFPYYGAGRAGEVVYRHLDSKGNPYYIKLTVEEHKLLEEPDSLNVVIRRGP